MISIKMERLQTILFSENSELRTTKKLNDMDNAVKDALKENPKEAVDALCKFFFSEEANSPIQNFCKNTQDTIKKHSLVELFETEASKILNESFWNNTNPNQNFTPVANAISLCGPDFVFKGNENALITKFALIFQSCKDNTLSENAFTSASKIIEMFVEYFSDPQPFQITSNISDAFMAFIENSSTFSILSTSILYIIQYVPSFDSVFSFIRSLAILLCKFLPEQIITSLYSTTGSSEGENLSDILSKYLNKYQKLLTLSVIARNLKNRDFCNFCFSTIKEMSDFENSGNLSVVDRVFIYNCMGQISLFITPLNEFVDFYGESLLRDFDSSNNLIANSLRTIFPNIIKAVTKHSDKSENDQNIVNHPTEEEVCEQLLNYINPLSFVSKLKIWLLPLLLKYIDTKSIPNEQLIKMAQDPSAGKFVSKCVKCIRGNEENGEGWKNLIQKCKEEAVQKCRVCGDMIVLRPILESLFDKYPESIEYAFQTLQLSPIPANDGNSNNSDDVDLKSGIFDDSWIITTWLMFECILSSPRSKWKLTADQIRLLIDVAIKCGNWDVRSASFTVFTVACFPQNESDIDFIIRSFENLLYFDSPKHISIVKATFIDFIERINKRSKTLKEEQINQIESELFKVACNHMIPSYISSHRQFAFDIAKPILDAAPFLLVSIKEDNYWCLRSVLSLFLDSNASLSSSSISLIRKLSDKNEEIKKVALEFTQVKDLLFPESKKQGQPNKESFESIQSILSQVENVQNWEEQCALFEEMNQVISRGKVQQEEIVEASEKLFKILLKTRILGVTCRGQIALESIAKKITPTARLESILDRWTDELMSTLDHFDMENMRRSAALPYLALSILRLNTPDFMQTKHSIFERLVKRLVEVIKETSSDDEKSSQEATHSLNMIRAVLTDKVTSPLSEVILPSVFESIFIVLEKNDNWDLVTAANLCLAAVIRKIKKKNVSQEDDNDTKSSKPLANDFDNNEALKKLKKTKNRKMKKNQQSLLLNQFFNKMPNSKESIINGLKSKSSHLNYLSLLTLSSFSSNSTSSETDKELQSLVIKHLVSSRDSRMRRLASRSAVAVTNENDLLALFKETIESLSHQSFNALHGQVMLLREILQHLELHNQDLNDFVAAGKLFPTFNWRKIPPFIFDDLFFVCHVIGRSELIPTESVEFNEFYYDQVSLFLHRPRIDQPLPVSAIVALLLRINASGRINEIDFGHHNYNEGQIDGEFMYPPDLKEQITSNVLVADMLKVNSSLLFAGLNFLIENPPDPERINSSLLISLINQRFQSNITAALIHLLFISLSKSGDLNQKLELVNLFDVLEDYVFDLSEEMTPVHLSIAEILPLLLSIDNLRVSDLKDVNYGDEEISKNKNKGYELALRLLIDDVPKVRTMTMLAVSKSFGIGLTSEIVLFEKVIQKLNEETEKVIARLLFRWIRLIYRKIDIDTHGEALCVIVDEFFIVTRLSKALSIDLNFDLHQIDSLLNLRKEFAKNALNLVTEKLEEKKVD